MTSSRDVRDLLALLLAIGWLVGSSAGCETPPPPPPSVSNPPPQASAVASAVPAAKEAKEAKDAIVIGERQVFHSTILGEDRTLLVHTPASYKKGNATPSAASSRFIRL
jgi:hypothetical protein